MSTKYWIKLYHEMLYDRKMAQLEDRLWRRVVECFLMAGEQNEDGYLPPLADMAWTLRTQEEFLETELNELMSIGVLQHIDKRWHVTKFSKRQAPVNSTDRVKNYRKRYADHPKDNVTQKSIYSKFPQAPGIYSISFVNTDKLYIGGAKNIQKRIKGQLTEMKTQGWHPLHESYMEVGFDGIEIKILEMVDSIKNMGEIENKWISKYSPGSLFNKETTGKNHREWNVNETYRSTDTDTDIDKKRYRGRGEERAAHFHKLAEELKNGN
jgi:hypothetical protein